MSEFTITTAKKEFKISFDKNTTASGLVNNEPFEWDVLKIKDGSFNIIKNNKSHNVEVVSANYDEKTFKINVDGINHEIVLKDRFDELLHSLGMDNLASNKVADVKAPMPGLVLSIDVKTGDAVKKGDALLILEAMKMENVLKSPTEGVIKSISVNSGEAVEKNQTLLTFE